MIYILSKSSKSTTRGSLNELSFSMLNLDLENRTEYPVPLLNFALYSDTQVSLMVQVSIGSTL